MAQGERASSGPVSIPAAYEPQYERASKLNPELAAEYVRHTMLDDPLADEAVAGMASLQVAEANRFIRAGMNRDHATLQTAPRALREFFAAVQTPPSWWDARAGTLGCRAFHEFSDLFIPAFFVTTVQNATTLIAKAFHATGRVNSLFGPRRIRQNTRHFIEIMLPGALDRHGEGWKLSVRIRLVHAQVRRLIRASGSWDESTFGVPLSSAHMGVASANFSATMLKQATRLGAVMDRPTRDSFMQIWRYASWLIGTPESLLFEGDEERTHEFSRIAAACEPPPGEESVVVANALFEGLPKIAGKKDPREARAMRVHAQRVTRALIGDELADPMGLPRLRVWERGLLLAMMRSSRRVVRVRHQLAPSVATAWRGSAFSFLLDAALLDDLSYRLPDHLEAEKATPW